MVTLEDVHEKLSEYRRTHRPELKLEESDWYSLYPNHNVIASTHQPHWPNKYPNCDSPGVYLIFGVKKNLLYIGKASMNNTIGYRLGSYFSYKDDKSCHVNHPSWSEKPMYIVTIAVPEEMSFEAPALEEYLIKAFRSKLPDNKVGNA